MKLTFELMQQLHRGEITPAEAFKRAGGTCPDPEVAQFQSMPCEQLAARLDAARGDIRDNGPDALRDLLKQTDALLARKPHWNKCQRAARFRSILAQHAAARAVVSSPSSVVSSPSSVVSSPSCVVSSPSAMAPASPGRSPGFSLSSSPSPNPEPRTPNSELPSANSEPGTLNSEPPPPFDLVIPLGPGSKHDNLELRFLLRSALANLATDHGQLTTDHEPLTTDHGQLTPPHGLRTIHIIGPDRPAWLTDHPMIRWHQWTPIKPKNHDIIAKFIHAANHPDVAEHFLGTCDDWLFLAPISPVRSPGFSLSSSPSLGPEPRTLNSELPSPAPAYGAIRRGGVLSTLTDKGYWKRAQSETRKLLADAGKPVDYFDYHVPTVMTKTGWRQVDAEIPWQTVPGHAVWSLYHNVAGTHGPVLDGSHITGWHASDGSSAPASLAGLEEAVQGKLFANYNDGGLANGIVEAWLNQRFPESAPWEADAQANDLPSSSGASPSRAGCPLPTIVPAPSPSLQASSSRAGHLTPTTASGGFGSTPFTPQLLQRLSDAGIRIEHPDLAAYHERWEKLVAGEHQTRPLPPPGLVTVAEPGNAHLGDQIAISNLPRLLTAKGYTVRVDNTRSAHAVFDNNPYVTGFGRQGQVLTPWICRTERGHVIQRFTRSWDLGQDEFPAGELYLTEDELSWARQQRNAWPDDKPVVLLSTGAVSSRMAYLSVDWQAIVDAICASCTVVAMVVTDPSALAGTSNSHWQRPRIADFRPDGCVVLENPATRQFMSLFAVADGAIGTMGGSSHVAASFRTPYLCVLPSERPKGFSTDFPTVGRTGPCDSRWIYPQHLFGFPTEQPSGFPLSRSELLQEVIHPSERAKCPGEKLSHIVAKYLLANHYRPRRIVEVGVRYGYSAAGFLMAEPSAEYHGFDIICHNKGAYGGIGSGIDTFPAVAEMLSRVIPGSNITLTHCNSQAMPAFPAADFYHIDGDHTTQGCLNDICKAWAACEPGGVVIVDDYDFLGEVKRACDLFASQNAKLIQAVRKVPSWRGEFVLQKRPKKTSQMALNCHYLTRNCGDRNAGASLYFPGMLERGLGESPAPSGVVVFGGGGLYHRHVFERAKRYRKLGAKIVLWGVGVVTEDRARGVTPWTWREFGDWADLCGLREDSPWEFVPCPSCMSPLFDALRDVEPSVETVYYNHPDKPVPDGTPRMSNFDTVNMRGALSFLSSGRRVVTSSYHGRVWATWLGREVVLAGPAAEQLSSSGEIPPLEEARAMNREFSQKVAAIC